MYGILLKAPCIYIYIKYTLVWFGLVWFYSKRFIGLVGRVFAKDPGDRGSITGRVIPETLKMVSDTYLFNTQHYKVRIKGKVEQSTERSSAFP